MAYGLPEMSIEAVAGAPAIKSPPLSVAVDYETEAPLSRFLPLDEEIPMARAYGSSAHLLMKRETAYGQAAPGDYIRMPSTAAFSEQGLVDDPVLGQGRDPLAPLQDVINDEGAIVVPRYLGLRLTVLFGDPGTTDNLDGS